MDKLKRIAEAIRGKARINDHNGWVYVAGAIYDPLTNDAQAMELVKVMKITPIFNWPPSKIINCECSIHTKDYGLINVIHSQNRDGNLNQAIVDCAYDAIEAGWTRE